MRSHLETRVPTRHEVGPIIFPCFILLFWAHLKPAIPVSVRVCALRAATGVFGRGTLSPLFLGALLGTGLSRDSQSGI